MVKECNSLQNKAISTSQEWRFFVLDVPVRSLPSSRADYTAVSGKVVQKKRKSFRDNAER